MRTTAQGSGYPATCAERSWWKSLRNPEKTVCLQVLHTHCCKSVKWPSETNIMAILFMRLRHEGCWHRNRGFKRLNKSDDSRPEHLLPSISLAHFFFYFSPGVSLPELSLSRLSVSHRELQALRLHSNWRRQHATQLPWDVNPDMFMSSAWRPSDSWQVLTVTINGSQSDRQMDFSQIHALLSEPMKFNSFVLKTPALKPM